MQNKLLTNEERSRRHLTITTTCKVCSSDLESMLHVLWDCIMTKAIWNLLVQVKWRRSFYSTRNNLRDRLLKKLLKKNARQKSISWNVLFDVTVWLLWTKRNITIFQNEKEGATSVVHQTLLQVGEIHMVWRKIPIDDNIYEREIIEVKWIKFNEGVVKLKVYGTRGEGNFI